MYCSVFTYEWNRVAQAPPVSHGRLPMCPPEATGGGDVGEKVGGGLGVGFRWHARAGLLTALLATAKPVLPLFQPAPLRLSW